MAEKLCELKKKGGAGGTGLDKRQYISSDYDTCVIGTYTSGIAITQARSYPHLFVVNVTGISGTLQIQISSGSPMVNASGIKGDVVTRLIHAQISNQTIDISDYDYISITGATGGATAMSFTITEV